MNGTFYDKIINVYFFNDINGIVPDQSLICSPTGYKPKIELSGSILPNSLYTHLELRITNASIGFDATTYKKVSIDAGYTGPSNDPGKFMVKGLNGTITQAYVESPGPDGVTVFIVLIGNDAISSEKYISIGDNSPTFSMPWGSNYYDIISSFVRSCDFENVNLSNYIVNMPTQLAYLTYGDFSTKGPDFQIYGTVGGILNEMINVRMGLQFYVKNNSISVFSKEYSPSINPIEIDRFSSTPSIRVSNHINFQTLWLPNLYPGDLISVKPEFMKMTFGGWQTSDTVNRNSLFNILKIDFDFSTIENTNIMIVDALSSKTVTI